MGGEKLQIDTFLTVISCIPIPSFLMFYYKLATYYRPRFYADVSVMPFDSNLIYIYISIVVALEETLYSRFFAFLNEKH